MIKKIIFTFLLILSSSLSFAMCAPSSMHFYPEQNEIDLNSMFIIEGYAMSQETIDSLKIRNVYLESENGDQIKLNLLDILKGQMDLTQAIFKSPVELKPNTTYFLRLENETEQENREMQKYYEESKKRQRIHWRTTDKKWAPLLPPNLKINFIKSKVYELGCGPVVNAIFNVKNKGDKKVWYKTELVDVETQEKTIYYITGYKDELSVGHGMCSGAFTFKRKGKYKVRFTPMNIDGKALKTTPWIIFDSPYMSYYK